MDGVAFESEFFSKTLGSDDLDLKVCVERFDNCNKVTMEAYNLKSCKYLLMTN